MKHIRLILLTTFFITFYVADTLGQMGDSIMIKKADAYRERLRQDSIEKARAEKIWESAVATQGVHQPDGYYTLNILNETNENAYIYIDGHYRFTVLKNDRITDHKVRNLRSIYAITYDKSYKWGPIDLTQRTEEDFFWKLSLPEKQTFEISEGEAQ